MKYLSLLLLALLVWPAAAQPPADPFAEITIPCTSAPDDAVLNVPAPANRWARLICTRYGHMAVAGSGLSWTFPDSAQPLFLPAQEVQDAPKEIAHQAYFADIDAWKTDFEEGVRIRGEHAKFVEREAGAPEPEVIKLRLTNQDGARHTLYILDWTSRAAGLLCLDECTRYLPFIITGTASS